MARKPNYRFERFERERTRAAKKAERAQAKAEKKEAEAKAKEGDPAAGQESTPDERPPED